MRRHQFFIYGFAVIFIILLLLLSPHKSYAQDVFLFCDLSQVQQLNNGNLRCNEAIGTLTASELAAVVEPYLPEPSYPELLDTEIALLSGAIIGIFALAFGLKMVRKTIWPTS